MERLTREYAKEYAELILNVYPDYWPLTEEQIFYCLLREGEVGTDKASLIGLQGISRRPCPSLLRLPEAMDDRSAASL